MNFTKRVGGKWKLPVINAISNSETIRFGKLHAVVDGISRKVLTDQLKDLEKDGLIIRKQFEEIPLRVEYSLREPALNLCGFFQAIESWSESLQK